MSLVKGILAAAILVSTAGAAPGATPQDDRMAWWREARFGMFIHWGLYSVLGGEWKGFDYGKEMGNGSTEWIMNRANIPKEEYAALAKEFNPVKFNAREWVSVAKEAGMKYMVFTAKHHEGFSMFATKMTKYNIIDATPFKRDPVRELAEECRRQGLKFGVYYSHSLDWYHRDSDPPSPEYVALVRGQLRELLTNYGDLATVWFDLGDRNTDLNESYGRLVKQLQPPCLIGSRLFHSSLKYSKAIGDKIDYTNEGDRRIPPQRVNGDIETPMTIRDNWGYDRDENNWKSEKDLIERLVLTACRGANMLLNVGPRPDGAFSPEEIARLKAIGRWMQVNGESVYGTTASPFDFDFEWGAISQKPGKLYLHVLKWNPKGIAFGGLQSKVTRAYLLADKSRSLRVAQKSGRVTVSVPARAPDVNDAVIALELDGPVAIDPALTYHWTKDNGVKLNTEKIEKQKALGWKTPNR